ncbi:RagB/SusD family nutrient uptake outer membrane protein [Mucilaginibacter sp. HC2]|uniref:RagB/SusD family nutrient uptake outer membrane protein n=1 Tax=Mucilaginibacter TaxID=423349 RepID=UPI000DCEA558|nr:MULTISPECIES: RagB/SusD family nutrient uptake outer membrane protein [Mucilaginibacter]NHA05519.1 RagB/SusD family nutrient uptake outer membrane protein [Mucilaginibacter inviolabilis]QTE35327.1 RagB/SusD family nutrient uptake outer membrane protein [Mucilaginibacter gossypii]RAV59470.1 hypothetical protein DIU36_06475 [Mucilaginibacter rubeus]
MKKNIFIWGITINALFTLFSCTKSDFFNKKPATNLLVPSTLSDFRSLLDNTLVFNQTGGLGQLSADEYSVNFVNWQTASPTQRNAYIWASDIYQGDVAIRDWNALYQEIFYANNVLDGLSKSDSSASAQGQYLKGWALFNRAYAFYDVTRAFCKAYDGSTASSDLGIPLRLSANINYIQQRSTLQQSFDQIINDLNTCLPLLPTARPSANLNRPSQIAAYALLARIYLDMRNYTIAKSNADQALTLYNTLIDYNTTSKTSSTPFSTTNNELIYNSRQTTSYGEFTGNYSGALSAVPTDILSLYSPSDLRLTLYFSKRADGTYYRKRGYYGTGLYCFTGLATDELYLIKAECLARLGQTNDAISTLNSLLLRRYQTGTFTNLSAASANAALSTILLERRKELMWRGLRWYDLKRLNAEGAQITLTRSLNGNNYSLPPNDSKWVMPIPKDEIALSGIQQNQR